MSEHDAETRQADVGQPERPDGLPDNFRSVEDLARSYRELQGKFTQTAQEKSELEQAWQEQYEASQYQEPAYQQPEMPGQDSPFLRMIENARDEGDLATEIALTAAMHQNLLQSTFQQQAQAAQQTGHPLEEAVNQMFAKDVLDLVEQQHPDWEDLREEVAQVIDSNHNLLPDTNVPTEAAASLSMVANMVRANRLAGQPDNQQALNQLRQQKQAAQGLTGQGMHPGTQTSDADRWAEIANAPRTGFHL